jgi:hypothetical protein
MQCIYIYISKRKETYQFEEPGPEHNFQLYHGGKNLIFNENEVHFVLDQHA